jgi:hypothetical protein
MAVRIGVDLLVRTPSVRWMDTAGGEVHERALEHERNDVRAFDLQFAAGAVAGLGASAIRSGSIGRSKNSATRCASATLWPFASSPAAGKRMTAAMPNDPLPLRPHRRPAAARAESCPNTLKPL